MAVNAMPTSASSVMVRPVYVTVICWVIIVTSALSGLMMVPMFLFAPAPDMIAKLEAMSKLTYQQSIGFSLFIIALKVVSGVLMLQGKNRGRQLYVGSGILGIVGVAVTSYTVGMALPGIVAFGVLAFCLYLPKADAYFAHRAVAP